jgi:hypothetical protein
MACRFRCLRIFLMLMEFLFSYLSKYILISTIKVCVATMYSLTCSIFCVEYTIVSRASSAVLQLAWPAGVPGCVSMCSL